MTFGCLPLLINGMSRVGYYILCSNSIYALSNLNQMQNRRRYVNFENGSHFICSLTLNNPELTVFITFKMTNIASENQEFVNSLTGNTNGKVNAKQIGLLIETLSNARQS